MPTPTYMFACGGSGPAGSMRSCSVMTVSSGGESGSGCRAAYAVVGEKGLTSGKMDEFSLKAAANDDDMDACAGCAWPAGIGMGSDDDPWAPPSGSVIQFE